MDYQCLGYYIILTMKTRTASKIMKNDIYAKETGLNDRMNK